MWRVKAQLAALWALIMTPRERTRSLEPSAYKNMQ
jgi:hypothetical protein